jgi:hypothetical protein
MYAIVEMQFNIVFCVSLLERYLVVLTYLRMVGHALVYMKYTSKILEYHRKSRSLFLKSYVDLN